MFSSFWKKQPLFFKKDKPYTNSKLIISSQELLQNKTKEVELSKVKLDYKVIINPDDIIKNEILKFINKYYRNSKSELSLQYSKQLLDYYITDRTMCIFFYTPGTIENKTGSQLDFSDKLLGLIIGKQQKLFIKQYDNQTDEETVQTNFKEYECIDVNFLCLVDQLRNMHVSSYMINVLTKECVEKFDIACAVYTVNKKLHTYSFCKKLYYHRPINVANMLQSKMLTISNNSEYTPQQSLQILHRVYNSFSYPKNFLQNYTFTYFTSNSDKMTDITTNTSLQQEELYTKLSDYVTFHYDIYDYRSKTDFINMLNNPVFHKFILMDHNNNITDFICLFNINSFNSRNDCITRNGYVFCFFLNTFSNERLSYILELIAEYCYKNDIFDVITTTNIFDAKPDLYKTFKLLRANTDFYYYAYNINMPPVPSYKNNLVTI